MLQMEDKDKISGHDELIDKFRDIWGTIETVAWRRHLPELMSRDEMFGYCKESGAVRKTLIPEDLNMLKSMTRKQLSELIIDTFEDDYYTRPQ